MKKMLIVFFLIIMTFLININISADMGPKPASFVTIKGIEGEYVACFAAKKADGPNIDYETWLLYHDYIEYNPIMEYEDEEGFKWITRYYECNGETEISFTYYCPEEYKIVIYQNDEFLIATEAIEMYAFSTYYEIDFSTGSAINVHDITIIRTYNYSSEIINLIVRIILTLVIEIGLFFLMRLYTKRNFNVVLLTNLLTQIFLNIMVNIRLFNSGSLSAIILLFSLEVLILIFEALVYQVFLKDKNRIIIVLYSIIANALSFGCGLYIFGLI